MTEPVEPPAVPPPTVSHMLGKMTGLLSQSPLNRELRIGDLVAPFAIAEDRQREMTVADHISGPLRTRAFTLHVTDPTTGVRTARTIEADAGDKLAEPIRAVAAET